MDTVEQYLACLFPDGIPEGSYLYVTHRANGKMASGNSFHAMPDVIKRLRILIEKPQTDVYLCMAFLDSNTSRKVENVRSITNLWCDIDFEEGHTSERKYPPNEATVRDILARNFPPFTLAVSTGHGWHVYLHMDKPCTDKLRIKALVRDFQTAIQEVFRKEGYELDSTFDLSRLLRVPGGYNWKQEPIMPVEIVAWDSSIVYTIEELEAQFPKSLEKDDKEVLPELAGIIIPDDAEPSERLQLLMQKSTKAYKSSLGESREDLKDNTTSGHDLSLADMLLLNGATPQEVINDLVAVKKLRQDTREKANSYYLVTLEKAITWVKSQVGVDPEIIVSTDVLRDKAKQRLGGLTILRFLQYGKSRATYKLELESGEMITLDSYNDLLEAKRFRGLIFEQCHHVVPVIKNEIWLNTVVKYLGMIVEVLDASNDNAEGPSYWLAEYLNMAEGLIFDNPNPEELTRLKRNKELFIKDGKLWLHQLAFGKFIESEDAGFNRALTKQWLMQLGFAKGTDKYWSKDYVMP